MVDENTTDIPNSPTPSTTALDANANLLILIPGNANPLIRPVRDLPKLLGFDKVKGVNGVPDDDDGDPGDFVISVRTANGVSERYLYGPKTAQGWGNGLLLGRGPADDDSDTLRSVMENEDAIARMHAVLVQIQSDLASRPRFLTAEQQAALDMFRQGFAVSRISPDALARYPHGYDTIADPDNPWLASGVTRNGQEFSGLGADWGKLMFIEFDLAVASGAADYKTLLSVQEGGVGVPLLRLVPDQNDFTRLSLAVNDHTPAHAGTSEVWHSASEHPEGYALRALADGPNGEKRFQTINRFPASTSRDDTAASSVALDIEYGVPNTIYEVGHSENITIPIANDSAGDTGAVAPDNAVVPADNTITRELYGWGSSPVHIGTLTIKVVPGTTLPVIEVSISALTNNYALTGITAAQHFSYHSPSQVAASDHWMYATDANGDIVLDSDQVSKAVLAIEPIYYASGANSLVFSMRELQAVGNYTLRSIEVNNVTTHWSLGLGDNDARVLVYGDYASRAVEDETIRPAGCDKSTAVGAYQNHLELAASIAPPRYASEYVMGYIPNEVQRRAALTGDIEIDNLYIGNKLVSASLTEANAIASTSQAGKVEKATQAEVNAGTDNARYVSPLALETKLSSEAQVSGVEVLFLVQPETDAAPNAAPSFTSFNPITRQFVGLTQGWALAIDAGYDADTDSVWKSYFRYRIDGTITQTPTRPILGGSDEVAEVNDADIDARIRVVVKQFARDASTLIQAGDIDASVIPTDAEIQALARAQITSANLPAATDSARGAVELATIAEAEAGSDATRAVTPAGVKAYVDTNGGGGGTIATGSIYGDPVYNVNFDFGSRSSFSYFNGNEPGSNEFLIDADKWYRFEFDLLHTSILLTKEIKGSVLLALNNVIPGPVQTSSLGFNTKIDIIYNATTSTDQIIYIGKDSSNRLLLGTTNPALDAMPLRIYEIKAPKGDKGDDGDGIPDTGDANAGDIVAYDADNDRAVWQPRARGRSTGNLVDGTRNSVVLPEDYADYHMLEGMYDSGFKGQFSIPIGYLAATASVAADPGIRSQGNDRLSWDRATRTLTTNNPSENLIWIQLFKYGV